MEFLAGFLIGIYFGGILVLSRVTLYENDENSITLIRYIEILLFWPFYMALGLIKGIK